MMSDEDIEREVHRIEQGANAWEDTEDVQLEVERPLEIVVPVRLSSETWEALRLEAAKSVKIFSPITSTARSSTRPRPSATSGSRSTGERT